MMNIPEQDEEGNYLYPSSVAIGEQVRFKIPMNNIETEKAYIRAIIFSNCKIRFSVYLDESKTTLHNVDSIWIEKMKDPKMMDFGEDNYS
jgi:hypothetical protein